MQNELANRGILYTGKYGNIPCKIQITFLDVIHRSANKALLYYNQ